jgi:hypothetical protein
LHAVCVIFAQQVAERRRHVTRNAFDTDALR